MPKDEKFVFRKTTESKRIKKVSVEKGERISKGGLFSPSGVYEAKIETKRGGVPMVFKEYPTGKAYKLEAISEVYKSMRHDRLRVPTTFRFDRKRGVSIMSDLNRAGRVALSSRNDSDRKKFHSVESFPDFDAIVRNLFEEALRASQLGYYIPSDSYFILLSQNPDIASDFVVGDLDTVSRDENAKPQKAGYVLSEAYYFLNYFIKNWMKPELAPAFKEVVKAEYQAIQEKAIQMHLMDTAWEAVDVR